MYVQIFIYIYMHMFLTKSSNWIDVKIFKCMNRIDDRYAGLIDLISRNYNDEHFLVFLFVLKLF